MLDATKNKIIFTIFSILTFGYLCFFVFSYYAAYDNLWIFFTSDTLYIPYLYQDLFLQGGKITLWKFSPVPYFFPDFLLYSLIAGVVRHLKLAIVLFGVAQLAIMYTLVVSIGRTICREKSTVLFHLSVFLSLLYLALGHLQQESLAYALVSQEHFGGALMFLLGLFLILRNFRHEQLSNYIFLGVVCFFTIFSDIVFVTQFFAPALASLLILYFLSNPLIKSVIKKTIVVITISVILSYIIYRLRFFYFHMSINPHLLSRTHFGEYKAVTVRIWQNLSLFFRQNTIFMLLWIVFVLVTPIIIIQKIIMRLRHKKILSENTLFIFTILFLFMAILMGYVSLLRTDNDILMPGSNGLRHYQPYLLFPVILGIPLYITYFTNWSNVLFKYYVFISGLILTCAFLFVPREPITNILNYYPSAVECLDQMSDKYHFKSGVADYWDSKNYTFFSKKGITSAAIEIDHVTHEINSSIWMSTMHDFIDKDFTFLIVNGALLTPDHLAIIKKKFGEPLYKLQCPSYTNSSSSVGIYLYPRGVINKAIVYVY